MVIRSIKKKIKKAIPNDLLNSILLAFPFLYKTLLVNYESNLCAIGIRDLLGELAKVINLNLDGDIIECGSSRCGTSIIMANFLRSQGVQKTIYACDSFSGFDLLELENEKNEGLAFTLNDAFTSTSLEYVTVKLKRLGIDDGVIPIKGYFIDTLPHINRQLCFAFIDCDLRDSLIFCAEQIWQHMPSKGRIIFDDYNNTGYRGARMGIEHFISKYSQEIIEHGLLNRLYYICKQ